MTQQKQFILSIPHDLTPRYNLYKQIDALVTYTDEGGFWVPGTIQVSLTIEGLLYIDSGFDLAILIQGAIKNNIENSQKEEA